MKITYYTSIDPRRYLKNTQFKTLADTAFELGQPGEMFELVAEQAQSYNTDVIQVRRSLKLTGKFQATFELHGRINVTLDNAQVVNSTMNATWDQAGTIILASDFEGTLSIVNSQVKYNAAQPGLAIKHNFGNILRYTSKLLIKDSTIDGLADVATQIIMQGQVTLLAQDSQNQCNLLSTTNWQANNVALKMRYGYLVNNAPFAAQLNCLICETGPITLQGCWNITELRLDQKAASESFKFIGDSQRLTQIAIKNLIRDHAQSGTSAFYANMAELSFTNAKLGQTGDQLQASIDNCKITMNQTNDNLNWILEGANVLKVDQASLTSLHQRENEFVKELPQAQQPDTLDTSINESDENAGLFDTEADQLDTGSMPAANTAAKTDAELISNITQPKAEPTDSKNADSDHDAKDKKADATQPDGMAQLKAMIGLTEVKQKVEDYVEVAKFNAEARKRGLKETTGMNRHMIFGGNPGTGKTTVAKYIAQILYEREALPENKFTSTGVRDLVGDHKGETAKSTHKVIDEALGGVLLIDEAYRLDDHGNSFGDEAIGELTQVIDDKKYRDNLIIILAGYSKPMKDLLNDVNPGFRSRFNNWIEFPDYSTSEKIQIFQKDCRDNGIFINPQLLKTKKFLTLLRFYSRDHANGRSVRNLFDSLGQARINRVTPQFKHLSDRALMTITAADILTVYEQAKVTLKRERQEKAQEKAKKLAELKEKGLLGNDD